MNMKAREARWVAGGLVAGCLLCCLLAGASRHQPAASPPSAGATPTITWPTMTGLSTREVRVLQVPGLPLRLPTEWVPGPAQPGYSLDLIDTHAAPPVLPDKL